MQALPSLLALAAVLAPPSGRVGPTPAFVGSLSARGPAFRQFVRRQVGRVVRLDVRFAPETAPPSASVVYEPYGYKGNASLPCFDVGTTKVYLQGVPDGKDWRRVLPYAPLTRRLSGAYRVRATPYGGGKTFDLTFVRR